MTHHTPGPWKLVPKFHASVESSTGRHVANCGGYTTNMDQGEHMNENEANARLIAAAPDLLEALEALLETAKEDRPYAHTDTGSEVFKAQAAIAKATGNAS